MIGELVAVSTALNLVSFGLTVSHSTSSRSSLGSDISVLQNMLLWGDRQLPTRRMGGGDTETTLSMRCERSDVKRRSAYSRSKVERDGEGGSNKGFDAFGCKGLRIFTTHSLQGELPAAEPPENKKSVLLGNVEALVELGEAGGFNCDDSSSITFCGPLIVISAVIMLNVDVMQS